VCDSALVGLAEFANSGRVVGCGALGSASGTGGIGGVDQRDEEHAVGFVLSFDDSFLCSVAGNKGKPKEGRLELCINLALCRSGDGQ